MRNGKPGKYHMNNFHLVKGMSTSFVLLFCLFPGRQRNNSSFSQPHRFSNRATLTNYDHRKAGGFCGNILEHSALRTCFVVKLEADAGLQEEEKGERCLWNRNLWRKEGGRKDIQRSRGLLLRNHRRRHLRFLLQYLSCKTSRAVWGFQQRSSEAGDCGKSLGSKVFIPPSFATLQLERRLWTPCSRQRELVAFLDYDLIWNGAFRLDSWWPHAQVCKHWTSSPLWTPLVSSPECHSLRWWRNHRCPLIKDMCAC